MLTVPLFLALSLPPITWAQTPNYPVLSQSATSIQVLLNTNNSGNTKTVTSTGTLPFYQKITGSQVQNKPYWNTQFTPLQSVRTDVTWNETRTYANLWTFKIVMSGSVETGTDKWDMFEAGYYTLTETRERNWQDGWQMVVTVTGP
jgi:hypothetical protein